MKITHFKILSDYRHLLGLELRFDEKVNTYVVIGNNGAGKSSLLEALSSIFHTLFIDDREPFEFCFVLEFTLESHKVAINNSPISELRFLVDRRPVGRTDIAAYLPQRVICNYSGEETRINRRYYNPVWKQYERRLKTTNGIGALRMVFVDKELWQIILLVIVSQRERYQSFNSFLQNILGVDNVSHIDITIDKKALSTWNDNPVSYYIRRLSERIQADGEIKLTDVNPDEDEALVMFNNLNGARSLINSIHVVFDNGVDSDFLSEGEKKWMVVLFILEVISNERSLVLLDEPDSHIHVARHSQLAQMFEQAINRDNIITSHSPSLTAAFATESIVMMDRDSTGHARIVDADKQQVVAKLTNGLWSIQEQNLFLSSSNDIILVEGKTDESFLSKALETFHAENRFSNHVYEFLPCGGAAGVVLVKRHFHPKPGQRLFCFFDGDKAGWDAINEVFEKNKDRRYDSHTFGRARKKADIWFAVYPCVKKQANNFNIEDYFPRRLFLRHILSFRSLNDVVDKKKLKDAFEADCNNGKMKPNDFKKFAAVFSLLDEMRAADAAGKGWI